MRCANVKCADGDSRIEAILRTGRGDEGVAPERDGGFEFERAGLRPDFKSRADDCRFGGRSENIQRPRFRGDSVSFPGPAIVGVRAVAHDRRGAEKKLRKYVSYASP